MVKHRILSVQTKVAEQDHPAIKTCSILLGPGKSFVIQRRYSCTSRVACPVKNTGQVCGSSRNIRPFTVSRGPDTFVFRMFLPYLGKGYSLLLLNLTGGGAS